MKSEERSPLKIYLFYCMVVGAIFLISQNILVLKKMWPQLPVDAPNFSSLFLGDDKPKYVELESAIAINDIDTTTLVSEIDTSIADSANVDEPEEEPKERPRQLLTYDSVPPPGLISFFNQLRAIELGDTKQKVRIMHLGDSQIELDRISSYVRNKLQWRFGGSGVGFVPMYNPLITGGRLKNEGSWYRYTNYGNEAKSELGSYGAWQSFTSFTPYPLDSTYNDTNSFEASTEYLGYKELYSLAKSFTSFKLFYELPKGNVSLKVTAGDSVFTDSLVADSNGFKVFEWKSSAKIKGLKLAFSGNVSPKFYGISLENEAGITLDNVAMRGSSGTFFNKNKGEQTAVMFKQLNPSLVILEYGGNVMPYIKDSAKCEYYGRSISYQIKLVKQMCPKAGIIFIGPADMSYKNGLYYETYPLLGYVRDVLKQVVHQNGAAYWDMYEAMGGENSMPSWVAADPPLAGNDYTHFTYKGAALISELFYYALETEYNKFITKKEDNLP
ncbi:MAG: hypothetical protein ACPGLV_05405 [Bacteroidia bacterium]